MIVAGDFNIGLNCKQDSQTKYFKRIIKDNKIKEVITMKQPTFHQHSGKGESNINYIFIILTEAIHQNTIQYHQYTSKLLLT